VTAVALNQGRSRQLWQVNVTDREDRLVAHGELRLQNLDIHAKRSPSNKGASNED
jgi:acyl-coenzyme A thioesterase PaaI-like protein